MNETENLNVTDPLLLDLVVQLSTVAMQQLGKLADPTSGKCQVNLRSAQYTIDLLAMIERKTRGNLSAEEQRTLTQTLTMLRLNYVETAEMGKKKESSAGTGAGPAPGSTAG